MFALLNYIIIIIILLILFDIHWFEQKVDTNNVSNKRVALHKQKIITTAQNIYVILFKMQNIWFD